MHVENNPDFKSIWQLAHDWVGEEPDNTDPNAISPELRLAIDRLMRAISSKEISGRWKGYRIFIDNFFLSLIFEPIHCFKFCRWHINHKASKYYLNNLYVCRNEVIDLCIKSYYDSPPCWTLERLSSESKIGKEVKNYRPSDETEDRIRCQAIASTLWELDPAIHPVHLVQSKIIQIYGNGRTYKEETIKEWIKSVDPQKNRKKGAPPKLEYKIELKKDSQLEN